MQARNKVRSSWLWYTVEDEYLLLVSMNGEHLAVGGNVTELTTIPRS